MRVLITVRALPCTAGDLSPREADPEGVLGNKRLEVASDGAGGLSRAGLAPLSSRGLGCIAARAAASMAGAPFVASASPSRASRAATRLRCRK